MSRKPVTFDFYSIECSDYPRFTSTLTADKTDHLKKWYKHKYQNVRLDAWEYKAEDSLYLGYCSKLNTKELPLKGSLVGRADLEELGLGDLEGTASITAFAIIPEHRTVIIQRNSRGVRAGSFLQLLCYATGINDLELSIMMDAEALRRLGKMKIITTFNYKIANPNEASNYSETSAKEAARLARHYQSRIVDVNMSMGNEGGSMSFQKVIESARNLLKLKRSDEQLVKSIFIKGKAVDDDSLEHLDLISRKMISTERMELKNRIIPAEDLMQAVYKAYNDKRKEIENYKPL